MDIISSVNIFPVPATDQVALTMTASTPEVLSLDILDVTGRNIHNQTVTITPGENTVTLNVADYAQGVYFATLSHESGIKTVKFYKQ